MVKVRYYRARQIASRAKLSREAAEWLIAWYVCHVEIPTKRREFARAFSELAEIVRAIALCDEKLVLPSVRRAEVYPSTASYTDGRGRRRTRHEYRFRLKARNGEIVASSEGYSSKAGAVAGALRVAPGVMIRHVAK